MPARLARTLVLFAILAVPAPAAANHAGPLAGQWHLDESQAATSHADSSGHNLTATEVGEPGTVVGRFGSGMAFPTEADYLNAGNRAALQPPRVTLLAWVRSPSTPPTVKAIASQGAAGSCSFSSYSLYTGGSLDNSGLRFYIWNGSTTTVSPAASNAIWNGAWHLVAGTYDGARVRLYIDGTEVGGGTPTTGSIAYGLALNNDFVIGGAVDPSCSEQTNFTGHIDEPRVYDRALTAAEIRCLAAAGAAPPKCIAGPRPEPTPEEKPTAELGRILLVKAVRGRVRVRLPGRRRYVRLEDLREVPVGSIFDTRRGTVRIRSARTNSGRTQVGNFSGGFFQVRQSRRRRSRGMTELRMRGGNRRKVCGRTNRSATGSANEPGAQASRRRRSRRRWRRTRARARGRFRTRGRYGAATVRGTGWTVSDRCDGTLTSVNSGRVIVRDFRRGRNIRLRRGQRYLARAGS